MRILKRHEDVDGNAKYTLECNDHEMTELYQALSKHQASLLKSAERCSGALWHGIYTANAKGAGEMMALIGDRKAEIREIDLKRPGNTGRTRTSTRQEKWLAGDPPPPKKFPTPTSRLPRKKSAPK